MQSLQSDTGLCHCVELALLSQVEDLRNVQDGRVISKLPQMLLDLNLATDVPQRHDVALSIDHRLRLSLAQLAGDFRLIDVVRAG